MKALLALTATLAAIACAAPIASTAAAPQGYRFITDTLAPGGTSSPQQSYRFITDTLAPGGGSTVAVAVPSGGFSWSDAGVGAGAGIGALLLLTGSTIVVLQRRGRLAL